MVKSTARILIVDDNVELLMGLKMFLAPHVDEIVTLKNPNQILSTLQGSPFDLMLLDMNFSAGVNSGNEGLYWLKRILETDPMVSVVLITGYGDVELAVKALKDGATDFILKSWDEEKILSSVLNALKLRDSNKEIKVLQNKQQHLKAQVTTHEEMCLTRSKSMQKVFETVGKVAKTDANILIMGENGTGKEVIAREIHRQSDRSKELFVTVDLGALSETLFESELFGYKKGAFTDAKEDKPGHLEIASGGTLFMDEIGNLTHPLQAKLLSVIQNRELIPLGSTRKISVNFRLISATNRPLVKMAEESTFREDLLYRINTILIELPPLRERKEDIPQLAVFFLKKYCKKYLKSCSSISDKALEKLLQHGWPGNIRELKHCIEKAVILSDNDTLDEEDFLFNTYKSIKPSNNLNLQDNEKQVIQLAIEKYKANLSHAAKALGINRSTLYEKIKRYDL
jgi:DNA-binding NtrC family response regulator